MTADENVMSAGESSVGAWLRSAREAAGLSEDAVAQQLKLAPRQVRAIEEDDYARLPGRTFVRGFVRNYARLVHLDPDAVVAALPVGESTSPLERLTYSPSGPRDEMPMESSRRGGRAARWLIPLVLLAVVAVAAYYEYTRTAAPRPAVPDGIMPPPPPPKSTAPAGPAGVPLPNPLDAPKSDGPPSPQGAAPGAAPAAAAAASTAAMPTTASVPPTTTTASSPASSNVSLAVPPAAAAPSHAPAAAAAPAGNIAPAPATGTAEAPLVFTFTGTSWVHVKDASGAIVLSQTGTSGTTLPVAGTPPLDVVVGNAERVKASFRGEGIDLAAHTRFNVARVTLR